MAIQFLCDGCAQPIEVDDEWASKMVACPYCHRAVLAPAESTLPQSPEIPVASPLAPGFPPTAPIAKAGERTDQPMPPPPWGPAPSSNVIAPVAALLALLMLGFMGGAVLVMNAHQAEINEFLEELGSPQSFSESFQQSQRYFASREQDIPRWMFAVNACMGGAGVAWIAAVICGVLGLRIPQRRGWAVAALMACVIGPLLLCCGGGLFLNAAGNAPAPGISW